MNTNDKKHELDEDPNPFTLLSMMLRKHGVHNNIPLRQDLYEFLREQIIKNYRQGSDEAAAIFCKK